MAITNQSVLKKMSNEIQEAMLQHGDEQKVREHVRSIRLLADLMLDEEGSKERKASVQEPSVEEIRQMMGADKEAPSKSASDHQEKDEEANGSSIFDF